jgi:lysosomal alpha-mannosidase
LILCASTADNVVLLRLAHQFAVGEDSTLSQPVTVSLTDIFPASAITAVSEMSLTDNQPVAALKSRMQWRTTDGGGAVDPAEVVSPTLEAPTVTLNPMQVCTTAALSSVCCV